MHRDELSPRHRWLTRWLLAASAFFTLLGAAIALAGTSSLFATYTGAMAARFYDASVLPDDVVDFVAFLFGPIGGSIAGKWVAAGAVVWGGLARGQRWAWRASVAGLVSWFAVDTTASIAHAAYFNVAQINLVPVVLFGLPLLAMRPPAADREPAPPVPVRGALWQRWLLYASIAFAVLGVVLTVAPGTALLAPWESMAASVFFGAAELPAHVRELEAFLFAPMGGTITGNFVLIAYLAAYPVRRGERWGLAAIALSLATWFVLDTTVSALHGAWFNVLMVNVPTVAVMTPPLFGLARSTLEQR